MPTASFDMLLATSVMIIIVLVAINGSSFALEPYLDKNDTPLERFRQIGRHIILSQGEPEDWGISGSPSILGLASKDSAFELDIDKVTRLNPSNAYCVQYSELWKALGIEDVSFNLNVSTIFDLDLGMASMLSRSENTTYTFTASTKREGYPLPSRVRFYVLIGNYTDSLTGITNSEGSGTFNFTLPNSLQGEALLIGFAQVEQSVVTYGVLSFTHNSMAIPSGDFATLSPLNYTLNVQIRKGVTTLRAAVFSSNYVFDLAGGNTSYEIPRLLDSSPMVLALTGVNGSYCLAKWVSYPQIPLDVGPDMSDSRAISAVVTVPFVVEVKGSLYRMEISFRSAYDGDY